MIVGAALRGRPFVVLRGGAYEGGGHGGPPLQGFCR
jgi:hypothetical protein